MTLFLLALGVMKVTELVKEIIPWPLQAWAKSTVSIVVAGIVALLAAHGYEQWLTLTLAGAGLAALLHEGQAAVSVLGDLCKQRIIIGNSGRRALR